MDYWHKQGAEPLFPDLLWSRPENRAHAGKLLIIGGNEHEFAAPANAYSSAVKAGIGTAKVLLPDKLQKSIGTVLENAEFAPSTKSGSFARIALAEWLQWANWANGVLLAGDIGRNSETAILLEQFIAKTTVQLTITKEVVDYFVSTPKLVLNRPDTTLVLTMAQFQKLASNNGFAVPIRFQMSLVQLVEALHIFTKEYACHIVVKHHDQIAVGMQGQVSTTPNNQEIWRVATAAKTSTWWLQNPSKPFEALTTSLL